MCAIYLHAVQELGDGREHYQSILLEIFKDQMNRF